MRLAFLSDIHFGKDDQDLPAFRFAVELVSLLNVDQVVWGGDIWEQVAVSRYPKGADKVATFQEEIEEGIREMEWAREMLPSQPMILIPGNHEERLPSLLMSQAKALVGLKALSFKSLYGLEALDIQCFGDARPVKRGHLYLAHGHTFATGGANPAKTALMAVNCNILFGHVHRFSVAVKNDLRRKTRGAWSNACLRSLTPGWKLAPEWSQGFTLVDFTVTGRFGITFVGFYRDRQGLGTVVEGKEYRPTKKGSTNGAKIQ